MSVTTFSPSRHRTNIKFFSGATVEDAESAYNAYESEITHNEFLPGTTYQMRPVNGWMDSGIFYLLAEISWPETDTSITDPEA